MQLHWEAFGSNQQCDLRWWEGNSLLCLICICLCAGQSMHCSSVVQERPPAAVSLARLMLCSAPICLFLFHFSHRDVWLITWENRSGLDGKSEVCGRHEQMFEMKWSTFTRRVSGIHTQCYCFCDRLNADEFTFNCTKWTRFSLPRFIRHEKSIFWCKESQERVQGFALQTIIFTPAGFSEINARATSWLFWVVAKTVLGC